ncbi:minor tail protein [Rhodococcus phage Shagrat]|nr:minor tail protein [Rhodococcus phage Shagrat]
MARATQRFLDEIHGSHTVVSYVDVIAHNQEAKRLMAVDGEINVDRTAQYRRAGRIECIDPLNELVPEGESGVLTPFGTEVRPYRGVRYADGTEEVLPLGVFRISRSRFQESSGANAAGTRISLELFDRSRVVSRDKFINPYQIPQGTNVIVAIKLILGRTFPDIEYDAISSPLATTAPIVYTTSDDPWVAVTDLATSVGCEIYFDVNGWVVIAPPTDIDALPAPDFEYVEGPRSTMVDLSREFSDEPGFNGVIVTGESHSDELPAVRAEAWDMEPSSPTYRYGPYGEVPQFTTDNNVKTVDDAQKVADSLLKGMIGFSSQLSVSSWTNPALEAGDVVQVVREKMHVAGLYAVDAFTVPLRKDGTQSLKLRTRRRV